MKYLITKDITYNCYVVWEVHKNYKKELFRGNKKECNKWLKTIK